MKVIFTQGFCILLKELITVDDIKPLLSHFNPMCSSSKKKEINDEKYKIISEAQKKSMEKWMTIGSLYIDLPDNDGRILIDIVDNQWPDHMGDVKDEVGLFSAWSMGYFGPFVYPKSLERALLCYNQFKESNAHIPKHQAFIRILMTYTKKQDNPENPDNYDPLKELMYMNKITSKLLEHPETLYYFNPNGEVLLNKEQFDNKLLHYQKYNTPPIPIWSNVRRIKLEDNWTLMDSVGAQQLDLCDIEVVFPNDYAPSNHIFEVIMNSILYLINQGLGFNDGETIDGVYGYIWHIGVFEKSLSVPPRKVYRFYPSDIKEFPSFLHYDKIFEPDSNKKDT